MTLCEVCGEWGQHPTAEHRPFLILVSNHTPAIDEAMDRLAHPDDYLRAPTSHDAPAEPSGVEGSEQR